jgi:hypothetical protein
MRVKVEVVRKAAVNESIPLNRNVEDPLEMIRFHQQKNCMPGRYGCFIILVTSFVNFDDVVVQIIP